MKIRAKWGACSSLVERLSYKQQAEGSIPSTPTRSIRHELSLLRRERACPVRGLFVLYFLSNL